MFTAPKTNSITTVASVYSSFFFTADLLFLGVTPCYSAAQIGIRDALCLVFRIPETGTKMTLLSASEDLRYRTLGAFPGPLEKLAYLARLRDDAGQYRHWGMSRTYGEQAAAAAMAEVHAQVWIEVLRTPVPELLRQLGRMGTTTRAAVIEELKNYRRRSCPAELSGGAVRHFNSVLLALECLSRSLDATPRAA
jgi:hypothetical protein